MSSTDVKRVEDFVNLLKKDKNAPIEEVIKVFESGDKTVPFNPEVTIGSYPENLPVCVAVRAQRFDILRMLVDKYHADTTFSFYMAMLPAVSSMDLVPVSEVIHVRFADFIVLACCSDFDMCTEMLKLTSEKPFNFSTCPKKLLGCVTQVAASCVDHRIIYALLEKLQILPTDNDGRTCLHHIAMRCGASTEPNAPSIHLLQELAKVRASINIFDDYGLTALQYACRSGCLAAVRVLLAAGADVNAYWAADSCTALHLAVASQNIDVVHELLHAGAKTDTEVLCNYVAEQRVNISGDPADVARAAGNFRLARYVADPLRSSLGVLLDSDQAADGGAAAAIMFEPQPGDEVDGICMICMEDTKLIPLSRCHHAFCKSCLAQWFKMNSNGVTRPQCPHSGCNLPVSIYDVRVVLGKEDADRVDQLLLQRSLAEMPDFRWCPRCTSGGFFTGTCHSAECFNCGYKFCTECQQEAHEGMTCREKCDQLVDMKVGTAHWMAINTKQCPSCHVPICKNGGCSHMRCSRCKYEFCWYCLGKYQGVYTFDARCPCPKRQNT